MFRGKAYASSFGRLVASRASSYDAPRNNNVTRQPLSPISTIISPSPLCLAPYSISIKHTKGPQNLDDWLPLKLLLMMPQGTIILPGNPFPLSTITWSISRDNDNCRIKHVERGPQSFDDWLLLELLPMIPKGTIILPGKFHPSLLSK